MQGSFHAERKTEVLEVTVVFTVGVEYGPTRRVVARDVPRYGDVQWGDVPATEVRKALIQGIRSNFTDLRHGMAIGSYSGDSAWNIEASKVSIRKAADR